MKKPSIYSCKEFSSFPCKLGVYIISLFFSCLVYIQFQLGSLCRYTHWRPLRTNLALGNCEVNFLRCTKLMLVSLRMNPIYIGVTTDQLLLDKIYWLNSIHTLYFLAWILYITINISLLCILNPMCSILSWQPLILWHVPSASFSVCCQDKQFI